MTTQNTPLRAEPSKTGNTDLPSLPTDPLNPWWGVIALAVITGIFLGFTLPGNQMLRIWAIIAPTLVAGFLGMFLARYVPLWGRLSVLGVALVLAIPAYYFVRTGIGVSHVEAHLRLADLQATPVDSPDFRAKFKRCSDITPVFPEILPSLEQVRQAWGRSVPDEMRKAAREAERGNAVSAKERMEALDKELANFGPWDESLARELEAPRSKIKECWLKQVPLAELKQLDGGDFNKLSHLQSQFSQVEIGRFPELVKEFEKAERSFAQRATEFTIKGAIDLARKDELHSAKTTLEHFRDTLKWRQFLSNEIELKLNDASKQVSDLVWQLRLSALRSTGKEDFAGFRKQSKHCREIVDSIPGAANVLVAAEKEWLEKSAQAAADAAEKHFTARKLNEAQKVLVLRSKELSEIPEFNSTQGPETLRKARGRVLTARLEIAASELKTLADAKKLPELGALVQRSNKDCRAEAKAIGADKELTGFLNQCVAAILADDCRTVEKLLVEGDKSLDAAADRVKKITRNHAELFPLVGGPGSLAEFTAVRRRVGQAQLNKAKRDLADLETLKKHAEIAQRATRLFRDWHVEADSIGLGDELWKLLTDVAQKRVSAAVELADADLEKLGFESAYQRLQTIGLEWAPILQEESRRKKDIESLRKILAPARQRLAAATLADAKKSFKSLLDAKDYAGLEKMKLSLEARKDLAAWGAGEAMQKFLTGCEFYLRLARDAGEIPMRKK